MYKDERVLTLSREELTNGTVPVAVLADDEAVFRRLADEVATTITQNNAAGRPTLAILPLGPVGQYPHLVQRINEERISLKNTTFINMDEYMWDETTVVEPGHPLSFKGAMQREFYNRVDSELLMPESQRVFPHPADLAAIPALIAAHGGYVDLCIGGLGINGHVAFNEPAPAGAPVPPADDFLSLPTRVVPLSAESILMNGLNALGGAYELMPRFGVTVGFAEIAASRRIALGCFRDWHRMAVRKAAAFPKTSEFPITLLAGGNITIYIPETLA